MPIISFQKNTNPYGWLGNMSAHPIEYMGKMWKTSEALFQALRYNDQQIQDEIRTQASPISAKMKAKTHRIKRIIEPQSPADLDNMRLCLKLKFDQHPVLKTQLIRTADCTLVEDIGKRKGQNHLFWGMRKTHQGWEGQNQLGLLLMELRDQIILRMKIGNN